MKYTFPAIFISAVTGKKVYVKRKQDFLRGHHLPVEEPKVVEVVEAAEEEEESAQAVEGTDEGKARFEEMKAGRYWTKGEEEAAEYQRMKAIHG